MKPISTASSAMLGVLVLGAAFTASNADAATNRTHYITATAVCVGPLPASDTNLRKNPLGIRNQGTANAFVSCSTASDFVSDTPTTGAGGFNEVLFQDTTSSGTPVVCTSFNGNRYQGFVSVVGVQTSLGGDDSFVELDPDKGVSWGSFNFSCLLPPGFEMGTIFTGEEDSGDGL